MKFKKLLVLTFGSLLSITSCGSNAVVEHEVDQLLPEDDPTSTVTINFWHCLGSNKTTNLQKIVDAFNLEYAGKYNVVLTQLAGDYDTLHDVLRNKLSAGAVPALSMGYPDSFAYYMTKNIRYSKILRLDSFIADKNGFGFTQAELDDFVPGYYSEGTHYQFSGTWSMPMYKSTEVMYYNYSYFMGCNKLNYAKFNGDPTFVSLYNEVLNDDGLEDPEQFESDIHDLRDYLDGLALGGTKVYVYDVPETWDEMMQLGATMNADRVEMSITDPFWPIGYDSDANMMISQMAQRGINYTTSLGEGGNHFLFGQGADKVKTISLIDQIDTYIRNGTLITKNSLGGTTYTNTYFKAEQCAMSIGSTGGSSFQDAKTFAVRVAPVPYSGDTPYYIQQGPSICFFDNQNGYIHKGAWLFYKYLADPENNANIALENSYDPVRISSYDTDIYKFYISNKGKGLQFDIPAITSTLKDHYMTSDVFYGSSQARKEIGATITYTMRSGYTATEAVEAAFNSCRSVA